MKKIGAFLSVHRWMIGILVLAAIIRFWQLGTVPPSPDWDEASLGYNAYSILKTGRDEYGVWLPRVLRSFDDYKPPLYAYLAIPSVALFGLKLWAVRLPSALAGVLAIFGTYLLVKILLEKEKANPAANTLARLSALLLALSPWHIQFSRIAFEANIGVTIHIWAIASFLKGLTAKTWLYLAAFLFALGFYAYHSERVFLPLILLVLVLTYRKEVFRSTKKIIIACLIGLVTIAPLVSIFVSGSTWTRLAGTSSLADKTGILMRSVKKLEEDQANHNPWGKVFDNRRIVYVRTLLDGYLSHYSLRWLFLTGDNDRHHAPDMGLLYWVELPFLLWGIASVWKWRNNASKVLFLWLLIAPIAASPTSELPHAIRTLVFLPSFQLFTAVGLYEGFIWLKRQQNVLRWILVGGFIVAVGFNLAYYFHLYFGHMNREFSQNWQYGYKEAVAYAREHASSYNKIVVSTKLEQPHMFFLFYLAYDPVTYLAEGGTASGGFEEKRNKFGIYEFRPINWGSENHDGSTLYIGTPKEIGGDALRSIFYLDGTEAIRIAK